MNIKSILFAISGILLISAAPACSKKDKDPEKVSQAETGGSRNTAKSAYSDIINAARTEEAPARKPLSTHRYQHFQGENYLKVQFPIDGPEVLVDSLRVWINAELGGTYSGPLSNGVALTNYYWKTLLDQTEFEDDDDGFAKPYASQEIELLLDTPEVVTFEDSYYEYMGGAHGLGLTSATSFHVSDGTTFGYDCFTSVKPLQSLLVKGLKKEFGVTTDADLLECLLGSYPTVRDIPFPTLQPWITNEGVVFRYTFYEIAPFCAGTPTFIIPFDDVAPYLTAKGSRFIDPFLN